MARLAIARQRRRVRDRRAIIQRRPRCVFGGAAQRFPRVGAARCGGVRETRRDTNQPSGRAWEHSPAFRKGNHHAGPDGSRVEMTQGTWHAKRAPSVVAGVSRTPSPLSSRDFGNHRRAAHPCRHRREFDHREAAAGGRNGVEFVCCHELSPELSGWSRVRARCSVAADQKPSITWLPVGPPSSTWVSSTAMLRSEGTT